MQFCGCVSKAQIYIFKTEQLDAKSLFSRNKGNDEVLKYRIDKFAIYVLQYFLFIQTKK